MVVFFDIIIVFLIGIKTCIEYMPTLRATHKKKNMVECLLMMQWVVGLILHGGPLELFFFCSSLCPKTGVTKVTVSTILSGMLYIKKKNLAANWKE